MPIPNLALRTGYQYTAEASGAPVNGNNTFTVPWGQQQGMSTSGDEIELQVISNGSSVTGASFVSFVRGVNTSDITISVVQSGADTATVIATYVHSIVR